MLINNRTGLHEGSGISLLHSDRILLIRVRPERAVQVENTECTKVKRRQSEGCRELDLLDQERKVCGEVAFSEPGTQVEGAPGEEEAGPGAGEGLSSLALQLEPRLWLQALCSAPEPCCFLFQLPAPKQAQVMPRHSASRRPSKYRLFYVSLFSYKQFQGQLFRVAFAQ